MAKVSKVKIYDYYFYIANGVHFCDILFDDHDFNKVGVVNYAL